MSAFYNNREIPPFNTLTSAKIRWRSLIPWLRLGLVEGLLDHCEEPCVKEASADPYWFALRPLRWRLLLLNIRVSVPVVEYTRNKQFFRRSHMNAWNVYKQVSSQPTQLGGTRQWRAIHAMLQVVNSYGTTTDTVKRFNSGVVRFLPLLMNGSILHLLFDSAGDWRKWEGVLQSQMKCI